MSAYRKLLTREEKILMRNIKKHSHHICYYCNEYIHNESDLTVDHRIPASRGGLTEPSNLVIACRKCNEEKGDMTDKEYKAYKQFKFDLAVKGIVHIDRVKIPMMFQKTEVSEKKINRVLNFYNANKSFSKPILVKITKECVRLLDGYSIYCVAKMLNIKELPIRVNCT